MRLGLPLALMFCVVAVITMFWWALGRPVTMPPSPLRAGEKIPCVSYAPFRRGQSPFNENIVIPPSQIDEDFAQLARVTDCVRIYAVDQGLENVPELARKHNLKVILGLWLGRNPLSNHRQIETAVRLANAHQDVVRMLVVGNETLLRGEMSEVSLGAILENVRARVSVPTTYADVWEFWIKHRALAEFVDVVTVHILPYWEDEPVASDKAGTHVADIRRHVGDVFSGKPILIGETGWPSEGRMRWGARATPADQARVMHDIVRFAKESGYDVNLIEAFDQPWKRLLEGTVGGYWGLLGADTRQPKFQWGQPVSNHPDWKRQTVLGSALALLIFAAAKIAGWQSDPGFRRWAGVAALAAISGCAIGLAAHMYAACSRTPFESAVAALCLAIAAGVPAVAAAGIVRGIAPGAFGRALNSASVRRGMDFWLGIAAIITTVLAVFFALGLVFDPRYRDFVTPVLAGPIAGIALAYIFGRCEGYYASERVFAVVLTASAIVIVVQETISNWEALAFSAALIILAGALAAGGRAQAEARPAPAR